MKNWKKPTIVFGIVTLAACSGLWAYWQLEPRRHFEQVEHPVLAQPSEKISEQPQDSPKEEEKSAFNVLILGTDARGNEDARTDVMMVAHVNPSDKTVNLVSIPRDTRINIPGIGYTKINHAHFIGEMKDGNHAGTEASLQAVIDLLNVPLNYYIKTDFQGFTHFIDTIDGVDVNLSHAIKLTSSNMSIPEGQQHLSGDLALKLVRERYSLPNGDFGRQSDQALILKAVTEKLVQPEYLPKLPLLISQIKSDVIDTNFSDSDLISLAWLFKGMTGQQLQYVQIPGHGEYAYDPLVQADLYYWFPDLEEVRAISKQYLQDPPKKVNAW